MVRAIFAPASCLALPLLMACGHSNSLVTSASDGGTNDAMTSEPACSFSPIVFRLLPPASGGSWQAIESPVDDCPMVGWLQVGGGSDAFGFQHPYLPAECATCRVRTFAGACWGTAVVPSDGVTQSWDGTFYATDTCGSDASACVAKECAPPGQYIARMCAYPCEAASCQATCVTVPFALPASGEIVGTLP
jgi:hypothetical protein